MGKMKVLKGTITIWWHLCGKKDFPRKSSSTGLVPIRTRQKPSGDIFGLLEISIPALRERECLERSEY
jgi:hypothetical protein